MRTADHEMLRRLAVHYPFNPYRHYHISSQRAQTDVLTAELTALADSAGGCIHTAASSDAEAAVIARKLVWDSTFFGVPMARIDFILGDDTARLEALNGCLDALRQDGVRHVSARIDSADVATARTLERNGFRLTGGTMTYTAHPQKNPPRPLRSLGRIRGLQVEDHSEVVALAEEAFRGTRGRFHMDPDLPRDRVAEFYTEWARRCVSYEMADTVLVSEGRDGRLLGFLAYRKREPLSSNCDMPVFGDGLGACRPTTAGAYVGLLRRAITLAHESGGVVEAQTQNYNFAVLRIYEALGLQPARGDYHFALSLD